MSKQQPMSPWVRRAMAHTLPVAVDGGRPVDPAGTMHLLSRDSRTARERTTRRESLAPQQTEGHTTD